MNLNRGMGLALAIADDDDDIPEFLIMDFNRERRRLENAYNGMVELVNMGFTRQQLGGRIAAARLILARTTELQQQVLEEVPQGFPMQTLRIPPPPAEIAVLINGARLRRRA